MLQMYYENRHILSLPHSASGFLIKQTFCELTGINHQDIYLLQNGKLVHNELILENSAIHVVPKLVGGKGGFGSMLRAIGAQIEKTTNREACRDLSGRRLRDINEEKRLKTWINQQVEREKEAADRKKKKLEKLCERPRHEFKDETYDKERSDLPEKVEDAVLQGLKAADSKQRGEKLKKPDQNLIKQKKAKLWFDADVDELSSSNTEESDTEPDRPQNIELGEFSEAGASCSTTSANKNDVTETNKQSGEKRKKPDQSLIKKKKAKLWIDAAVDELSSSNTEESDAEPDRPQHIELGEASQASASCSTTSANKNEVTKTV